MLTRESIIASLTIRGDLNLKYVLYKNFSNADAKSIYISARTTYDKLIENYIATEGIECFNSETFYNPEYKLIKDDENNFNLIIVTPFGIYNTIEIVRKRKHTHNLASIL